MKSPHEQRQISNSFSQTVSSVMEQRREMRVQGKLFLKWEKLQCVYLVMSIVPEKSKN